MDLVGAVDIGASKTLVTVCPAAFTSWEPRLAPARFPTPPTPSALVDALEAELGRLAATAGGRVVAVGLGTPGPLDAERGVIIHSPNQGWRDVPLGPLLEQVLGVPVRLDDDANAGALGEALLGAGRGADPVTYVTVSTGIGAGIVIGGHVLRGAHGSAGEIGHLVVDPAGIRCSCGHRGCVETLAAGGGIERRARAAWATVPRQPPRLPVDTGRDGVPPSGTAGATPPVTAGAVFRAARAGDPDARQIVDEAVGALAFAFAAMVAALDPERIVVGGAVGLAQRGYVRRAASLARRRCIAPAAARLQVVPAALGRESVLAGAAVMAARAYEATG